MPPLSFFALCLLLVASAQARVFASAHTVELVNEDGTTRVLPGYRHDKVGPADTDVTPSSSILATATHFLGGYISKADVKVAATVVMIEPLLDPALEQTVLASQAACDYAYETASDAVGYVTGWFTSGSRVDTPPTVVVDTEETFDFDALLLALRANATESLSATLATCAELPRQVYATALPAPVPTTLPLLDCRVSDTLAPPTTLGLPVCATGSSVNVGGNSADEAPQDGQGGEEEEQPADEPARAPGDFQPSRLPETSPMPSPDPSPSPSADSWGKRSSRALGRWVLSILVFACTMASILVTRLLIPLLKGGIDVVAHGSERAADVLARVFKRVVDVIEYVMEKLWNLCRKVNARWVAGGVGVAGAKGATGAKVSAKAPVDATPSGSPDARGTTVGPSSEIRVPDIPAEELEIVEKIVPLIARYFSYIDSFPHLLKDDMKRRSVEEIDALSLTKLEWLNQMHERMASGWPKQSPEVLMYTNQLILAYGGKYTQKYFVEQARCVRKLAQ